MLPPPAHPDLPLPQGSGPCLVYTSLQGSLGTHILTSAFQDLGRISVLPFILPRHSIHSPAKQQEACTPVLLPYGYCSDLKHPFQKSTVVSLGLSCIPPWPLQTWRIQSRSKKPTSHLETEGLNILATE